MSKYIISCLVFCIWFCADAATGADTLCRKNNSRALGINLRPSAIIPTHGFYKGWNPESRPLRAGGSVDFQYMFSTCGHAAYQGAGAGVHTFFADRMLGTPVTFYIFQGAPLARISPALTFGYEWNLGISANWRDNGTVTVSPVNVYINVACLFNWRLDDRWSLYFGPEYTHFSNGDTMFPNGGANTVNFRIGTKYSFNDLSHNEIERVFESDALELKPSERMTYDLTVAGGWRADRQIVGGRLEISNKPFAIASVSFNPLYHFNDYFSVGPALDLTYDASANREYGKSFAYRSAAGISARAELKMPLFGVNVGFGYNVLHKGQDLSGVYGIFNLKAFLSKRLYLSVSYRLSSVMYSHNMLFGAGWRFGNIR